MVTVKWNLSEQRVDLPQEWGSGIRWASSGKHLPKYTIFLAGSFNNSDNVRAQSNLQEKDNLNILKKMFFPQEQTLPFSRQ